MKKALKKLVCLYFQIGVNVIGIPEFHKHEFRFITPLKSRFHK